MARPLPLRPRSANSILWIAERWLADISSSSQEAQGYDCYLSREQVRIEELLKKKKNTRRNNFSLKDYY